MIFSASYSIPLHLDIVHAIVSAAGDAVTSIFSNNTDVLLLIVIAVGGFLWLLNLIFKTLGIGSVPSLDSLRADWQENRRIGIMEEYGLSGDEGIMADMGGGMSAEDYEMEHDGGYEE